MTKHKRKKVPRVTAIKISNKTHLFTNAEVVKAKKRWNAVKTRYAQYNITRWVNK